MRAMMEGVDCATHGAGDLGFFIFTPHPVLRFRFRFRFRVALLGLCNFYPPLIDPARAATRFLFPLAATSQPVTPFPLL